MYGERSYWSGTIKADGSSLRLRYNVAKISPKCTGWFLGTLPNQSVESITWPVYPTASNQASTNLWPVIAASLAVAVAGM